MEIDFTLYWVRLPTHTDPYTEGYIGVTRRPIAVRFKAKISKKVKECLDSGGIIQTLHLLQSEDALYAMEQYYRPHPDIGLNTRTGGKWPERDPTRPRPAKRKKKKKEPRAEVFSPTLVPPHILYPWPIGRPLLV